MIRVWDFYSGKMLYKVKIHSKVLKGIHIVKDKKILIGYNNDEIQILDRKEYKAVKSLNHNKTQICSIKKIYLNDYGSCFFSQGIDNHIIMWQLKE